MFINFKRIHKFLLMRYICTSTEVRARTQNDSSNHRVRNRVSHSRRILEERMDKCGTFLRSKHTSQSVQLLYETDRVYLSSREAFKYIKGSQHRVEHLVEWEHIHSKNVFTRCSTVYVCRSVVAQSGGNLKGGKFNDLLLSSKKPQQLPSRSDVVV